MVTFLIFHFSGSLFESVSLHGSHTLPMLLQRCGVVRNKAIKYTDIFRHARQHDQSGTSGGKLKNHLKHKCNYLKNTIVIQTAHLLYYCF